MNPAVESPAGVAGHPGTSSSELRQALDRLADVALDLVHADLVTIWVIDERDRRLIRTAQRGQARAPEEPAVRGDEALAEHVIRTGAVLSIDDIDAEPRVTSRAWFVAEGIRALLAVPIALDDRVVGIVACMARSGCSWTAEDAGRVETIAAAAVVPIQAADLQRDAERRVARLRALTAVEEIIASSLDLGQVVERVAHAALDLLASDAVGVWIVDEGARRARLAATSGRHGGPTSSLGPFELALEDPAIGPVLASGVARYSIDADDGRQSVHASVDPDRHAARVTVPLVAGDGAFAVLIAVVARPRRFDEEERELVTAFAAKAATAIQNATLYEETRRRLAQTETLLAVAGAVSSTLDFGETIRRVARETGRALGADMVGAYLADAERTALWPVAGYHVPPQLVDRFLEDPVPLYDHAFIEEAWRSQRPTWCADVRSDARVHPTVLRLAPVRSMLFCPLAVKHETIGGLFLIWWLPRPEMTRAELELLGGIANQTALAIDNAQLFEARGRDTQRLEALSAVSRQLTAILDPREVLPTITRLAAELLDARLVRLWGVDPGTGDLTVVAAGGPDADIDPQFSRATMTPGSGIVGTIFDTHRAEFIPDVGDDPRWVDHALLERLGLRGYAGVPLLVKDAAVGVLTLFTRRAGAFSAAERTLIEAFASQAALAIHNARLFERMQASLRETQALLGVADSLTKVRDVGEIMRRVCREATRAIGADSGVFYTVDDGETAIVPAAGYRIPKPVMEHAGPIRAGGLLDFVLEAVRTRQVRLSVDVDADHRFHERHFKDIEVRSIVASAVHLEDRVFGVLVLYWWDAVREITPGDVALMSALSAQAALVLENARLLVETQSQAAAVREKNAELDSFVYTVSHDLKAPLVTIQGMSELVLEEHGGALPEDGRHYLTRIQANTRQMERLILDLLALSRVGREARAPETVDLRELVDDVVAELGGPLREHGIAVVVGPLGHVRAIRVQMEQVVRNLVTNAVKYMGPAPAPTIELGAIERGAVLEVWIRDTGIGIDPAYHEKVFEIFQRLKEIDAEGTGVGLSIVKKIVEGAGGRIWVESARGAGATFRFTWPLGSGRPSS